MPRLYPPLNPLRGGDLMLPHGNPRCCSFIVLVRGFCALGGLSRYIPRSYPPLNSLLGGDSMLPHGNPSRRLRCPEGRKPINLQKYLKKVILGKFNGQNANLSPRHRTGERIRTKKGTVPKTVPESVSPLRQAIRLSGSRRRWPSRSWRSSCRSRGRTGRRTCGHAAAAPGYSAGRRRFRSRPCCSRRPA